jgi:hypothetical protein
MCDDRKWLHAFESEASQMTIEQVRTAATAKPFRPFLLQLADGREIPVQHPEFMPAVPSGRTIVVCQPDDTVNIIDLLLVTDLEFKPAKNGAGKRKRA